MYMHVYFNSFPGTGEPEPKASKIIYLKKRILKIDNLSY